MPEDEDLPIFSPSLGGGSRGRRGEGPSFRNTLLAHLRGAALRTRRASARTARPAGPRGARRVVIKAHVHQMGPSGAKAAALHLRYIERDGVERDGSKGVLYAADGPAPAESFEQPRPGEKHQFRIIVSPEDGAELDLTAYVRRLMATVELDLGRRIEWAAVNHHDTSHPHAHIVIRGVDRDGCELRFDRAYISSGLRWRAQELATDELGPRLEQDVRRAHEREVIQERFTSLDHLLERRAQDGRIEPRAVTGPVDASLLVARLEHLEGLRLAERVSRTAWQLSEGWQERLRRLGARIDILQQIHAAVGGDTARYHVVERGGPVPTDSAGGSSVVSGRVASKGLSDELRGHYYAVVETPAGRAYHVPLDRRQAESLRTGDVVSLTTKAELSADQVQDRPVRHRVVMHRESLQVAKQIRHPGPVWLDRVKAESLAPYGFGADLRQAIGQRREALRHMGVHPDDPNRSAQLRALERVAVGRERAAATGQRFLASVPQGFRGRLKVDRRGSLAAYAVVSDGERFVVLRATAALRASSGKMVTMTRDARGRLLVRPTADRELGL